MRFLFVLRSRHAVDIKALNADRDRLRRRAETAEKAKATAEFNRLQVLEQNSVLHAANQRLSGRNLELGRRVSRLTEADPEYAAQLEQQVAELREALSQARTEARAEKRRADVLQRRLDDAVGLHYGHIEDSRKWQPGYQKPKAGAS
ncbi:MAG TPA: hypothetical protein VIP28_10790 [Nocardioides sp.]